MARRELVSPDGLLTRLNLLKTARHPVVLYVTSTKTVVDGVPRRWCPDCAAVESVAEEIFEASNTKLLVLQVELEREAWKVNPGKDHFLRKPPFGLKGIPSICIWSQEKNRVVKTFTEWECEQMEMVSEAISAKVEEYDRIVGNGL